MSAEKQIYSLAGIEELGVNKEDILAIGVAKFEETLLLTETELKSQVKALNEKISGIAATIDKAVKACGTDFENSKACINVMKFLKKEFSFSGHLEVFVSFAPDHKSILLGVELQRGSGYGRESIRLTNSDFSIPVPKNIVSLLADQRKANEELQGLAKQLSDTMRKKSQLPFLERKLRAGLATSILSKSQQGQAILEVLKNGTVDVLGLPSPGA